MLMSIQQRHHVVSHLMLWSDALNLQSVCHSVQPSTQVIAKLHQIFYVIHRWKVQLPVSRAE